MLVVGEREAQAGAVALRKRDGAQQTLSADEFVALLQEKIATRAADL